MPRGAVHSATSEDTPMSECTAVKQTELMSSSSPQTAMLDWPSPRVYFPTMVTISKVYATNLWRLHHTVPDHLGSHTLLENRSPWRECQHFGSTWCCGLREDETEQWEGTGVHIL